jgi:hypothetical protein
MPRTLRLLASIGLALLLTATFALTGSAHEHRKVADDTYELTVGFIDEPAFVNLKNGLSLRVVTVDGEKPVEGLVDTLKAEVIYGADSMELDLEPVFNDPGHYEAVFFPTATGAYTFHISGEIEGHKIDEKFESGPETFSEVEPIEPLQFPKPADSSHASSSLAYPAEIGAAGLVVIGAGWWLGRTRWAR